MSTYTTAAEDAAQIRASLKKHGYSSRDVSVRADCYSMGSSIHVTIKNPDVPAPLVRGIAEQKERIHRCEIAGEILGGGNRFVEVGYSREAREALAARYLPAIEDACNRIPADSNALEPIGETGFLLGYCAQFGRGHGFSLWSIGPDGSGSHVAQCWTCADVAIELAAAIQRKVN